MAGARRASSLSIIAALAPPCLATSVKMDFLPLADVRTDALLHPTCLSDHVHTFYGAQASLRPEMKYDDLRAATGNSGNVEENKSLYWHPTVYRYDRATGKYHKAEILFSSAYYVWATGSTTAFPNGFNMIATGSNHKSRVDPECVAPQPCELDDCSSDDTRFFPSHACAELEVSMSFPTCWDGENLTSPDMMSHVSYDLSPDGWFDEDCPASHPVKLPEIQFYFRIAPYPGGQHVFSDGSSNFHADYFSGWNATQLQWVLNSCHNPSDAASPDAWCEDFLTFRDGPKNASAVNEDVDVQEKLGYFQPPPLDTRGTISAEKVDNVTTLPRGACSPGLIPLASLAPPSPPRCPPQTCQVSDEQRSQRCTCRLEWVNGSTAGSSLECPTPHLRCRGARATV
jgi:hypothetical protein